MRGISVWASRCSTMERQHLVVPRSNMPKTQLPSFGKPCRTKVSSLLIFGGETREKGKRGKTGGSEKWELGKREGGRKEARKEGRKEGKKKRERERAQMQRAQMQLTRLYLIFPNLLSSISTMIGCPSLSKPPRGLAWATTTLAQISRRKQNKSPTVCLASGNSRRTCNCVRPTLQR